MLILLPMEERKDATCFRCGTNLSVKYSVTVRGKPVKCCNRCALMLDTQEESDELISDLQMEQREQM